MSTHEEAQIERYSLFDRLLHWFVTLTFVYLLLSGLAIGYPRMAWLFDILGGGQIVRSMHPWMGAAFTLGIVVMLFAWTRSMRFEPVDREWGRNLGRYAREGHVDLDVSKYNAGQKGYYWYAIVTGLLLLLTGIPLRFPSLMAAVGSRRPGCFTTSSSCSRSPASSSTSTCRRRGFPVRSHR